MTRHVILTGADQLYEVIGGIILQHFAAKIAEMHSKGLDTAGKRELRLWAALGRKMFTPDWH